MDDPTPEPIETLDEKKETSAPKKEKKDWHRIFATVFNHTFEGTPFEVKVELDVATTPKKVDIVVRPKGEELPVPPLLAEGVDRLNFHNLFTFKSYQEPFDHEAIEELIAYFNLYLKTEAPAKKNELDRSLVRLFGVCVRSPRSLLGNSKIRTNEIDHGVYDVEYGVTQFRLIVVNELELREENANLLLFSNLKERVQYGKQHHSLGQSRYETLIGQLLTRYQELGDQEMIDLLNPTEEDVLKFWWDTTRTHQKILKLVSEKGIDEIPEEVRLKGISAEKLVQSVSVDDVLKGFTPDQIAELKKRLKDAPENPAS